MNVVVVLASPYPAPRGSQLLVGSVEQGLRERGHDVTVVSYGPWLERHTGMHAARPVLDLLTAWRLARVVARARPDVIHAHNYEGVVVAMLVGGMAGVPVVFHGHSLMEVELPSYARTRLGRWLRARLGRLLDRHVPPRAAHCIAVTDELREAMTTTGARATTIRPALAPGDRGEDVHRPTEAPDPVIVYAGNLDAYQNLGVLLEAFGGLRRAIPSARLHLITHGSASAPGCTDGDGVRVVRVDSVAGMWAALGEAWLTVVPRSDGSGYPMKLLNYMAAGKPIVVAAGAAHGLRDGVDAVVVPNDDPGAFASAMIELVRNDRRREELAARARALGDDAAWKRSIDALEEVYSTVTRPSP